MLGIVYFRMVDRTFVGVSSRLPCGGVMFARREQKRRFAIASGVAARHKRKRPNRGWRICKPLPTPDISEENAQFQNVGANGRPVETAGSEFDPGLAAINEGWPNLSPAKRAALVAMYKALVAPIT